MYKLTISGMQNTNVRSFKFGDLQTAMSHFHEHMDANNINQFSADYGHEEWLNNPLASGEFEIATAGGIGHDVRIELTVTKAFAEIHANASTNMWKIENKLHQLGARNIGRNDDNTMDFWQYQNRVFIIQDNGNTFNVFCSMEFHTLDSAITQIENICRIQKFMA
jgi:hypothetical protein